MDLCVFMRMPRPQYTHKRKHGVAARRGAARRGAILRRYCT
jgi:hypothetical protein